MFVNSKTITMRKFKYLIILSLTAFAFTSCTKEDDIVNSDTVVGHSRVTFFPSFNMKGDKYMSIVKGGNYTEPGVTAKEGQTDLPVTITGSVNASQVGVYDIIYTATNKDGFSSSVTRTIAVLPEAERPGADISGNYKNTGSFSYVANMKKLAPGFYLVDNIWGGGSAAIIASYVISTDGATLILPLNSLSPYGKVQGTGVLDDTGKLVYTVSLLDLGVNNSKRTWQKI